MEESAYLILEHSLIHQIYLYDVISCSRFLFIYNNLFLYENICPSPLDFLEIPAPAHRIKKCFHCAPSVREIEIATENQQEF